MTMQGELDSLRKIRTTYLSDLNAYNLECTSRGLAASEKSSCDGRAVALRARAKNYEARYKANNIMLERFHKEMAEFRPALYAYFKDMTGKTAALRDEKIKFNVEAEKYNAECDGRDSEPWCKEREEKLQAWRDAIDAESEAVVRRRAEFYLRLKTPRRFD